MEGEKESTEPKEKRSKMPTKSILIVDDNPVNSKLIRVLLAGEGYDVHTAGDADEALRVLKNLSPQLILMDVQLPGIDGLELTCRLKADPATRDIKILGLTAYAMKGDREKILAAGCDGYLSKPVNVRELIGTVRQHCDGRTG